MPTWTVELKESVIKDLEALGSTRGRAMLKVAAARLTQNPLAETRQMKTLRRTLLRNGN